jgi:hypothetical protein
MGNLDRRYALVGWVAWKLAKRRLLGGSRQKVGRGRTFLRVLGAILVLAGLAALWAKRAGTQS